MFRGLAIDPGTDKIGICFFEVSDDLRLKVLKVYTYSAKKDVMKNKHLLEIRNLESVDVRINLICDHLSEQLSDLDIDFFVYETPFLGKGNNSFSGLLKLNTHIVQTILSKKDIPIVGVTPGEVKALLQVTLDEESKDEVRRRMVELLEGDYFECDETLFYLDEHSIDALSIMMFAYFTELKKLLGLKLCMTSM